MVDWLRRHLEDARQQIEPPRLTAELGARRLTFRLHQQTGDDDWLIVMREVSDSAVIEAMSLSFKLTAREAEVLYWVVKGKINRDIADILGASPATVKKHLERVFAKLGVETRTAAAGHGDESHPAAASAVRGLVHCMPDIAARDRAVRLATAMPGTRTVGACVPTAQRQRQARRCQQG